MVVNSTFTILLTIYYLTQICSKLTMLELMEEQFIIMKQTLLKTLLSLLIAQLVVVKLQVPIQAILLLAMEESFM